MIKRLDLHKDDFRILDSIRGIASLYVVIAHCRGLLWIGGRIFVEQNPISGWSISDYLVFGSSMLTRLAVEFVIVFFVLSGFSIAHSLARGGRIGEFYTRRILRIYPPYILALIWAAIAYLITKQLHPEFFQGIYDLLVFSRYEQMNDFFEPQVVIGNLLYMPSNGFITPFWSLSHEVIFYLLAPFILLYRRVYYVASIALFVVYLLAVEIFPLFNTGGILLNFVFVYNFFFFVGIWTYANYEKVMQWVNRFWNRKRHLLMILLALSATYGVNFAMRTETVWSFIPSAALSILLITFFLRYQVKIGWLMWIGKFSYTLYITHVATIFIYHSLYFTLFDQEPPYIISYWVWIPAVIVALLMAFVYYEVAEKHTKRLLDRIRKG